MMPPQKKCRAPMAKLALSRTETPVTWVVVPAHPFTRSRVIPALLSRVRENPSIGHDLNGPAQSRHEMGSRNIRSVGRLEMRRR